MNLQSMDRAIRVQGATINENDIKGSVYKGHVVLWFNHSSYISRKYYGEYSVIDADKEVKALVRTINQAFVKYGTDSVNDQRVLNDIGIMVDKYTYKKYEGIVDARTMLNQL